VDDVAAILTPDPPTAILAAVERGSEQVRGRQAAKKDDLKAGSERCSYFMQVQRFPLLKKKEATTAL
jgi:hypothetical protein